MQGMLQRDRFCPRLYSFNNLHPGYVPRESSTGPCQ